MKPKSGNEKRRTARVRCEAPLAYTPYTLLLPRLESVSRQGTSIDVSVDNRGLSFVTPHPLFTGRRLQVVAGGVVRPGVVRWVAAVPVGYRVGVSLSDEPHEARR